MIDTHSNTWASVKELIEENRARSLSRLMHPGKDIQKTEFERGYLKALAEVEALEDPQS